MKCPSSKAPASRNSCRTSSFVIAYPVDAAIELTRGLAAQAAHDFVEMFQIVDFEQDVEIEEIARPAARHHLQLVDIAAGIADHLGDLGQGADLVVDRDLDAGRKALVFRGRVPGEVDPALGLAVELSSALAKIG